MEIQPDAIISSESYDSHSTDENRAVWAEAVNEFVQEGRLTRQEILQRLTDKLARPWAAPNGDGVTVLHTIEQQFVTFADPDTGLLSPEQLNSLLVRCTISPAAAASAADPSSSAVDSLGALVRWHAVFPFPAAPSSSFAGLDLPSLLRALALLLAPPPITPTIALDTATAGGPLPPSPCGVRSGRWAAHDGWLVTKRGRGAEDALRRVFRSLAAEEAPTSPPAAGAGAGDDEATAVVRVPRFVMYVPRGTNDGGRVGGVTAAALADDDNDDLGQQVVVVQDEDERTVDLLDVLSECPPDEDRKTANPLRENWVGVLAALPRHDRHLGQLGVPRARLAGLLGLLADADPDMHRLLGPSGPLNGLTATPFGEDITWDAFNSALLEYTEPFYRGISKIFEHLIQA